MMKKGTKVFTKVLLFICLGCLGLAQGSAQTPVKAQVKTPAKVSASNSTPAQASTSVVVTPKTPYDSAKAKLASTIMENLQLKSQMLISQYKDQYKAFQDQYNAEQQNLQNWENNVRKDNGWDTTYTYDVTSDTWTHTTK